MAPLLRRPVPSLSTGVAGLRRATSALSPPSSKSPQPSIEEQGRMNITSAEVPLSPPSPDVEVKSSEISPKPSIEEKGDMNMTSTKDVELAAAPPSECDIFDGRWVYDPKAYPLYQGYKCPFLSDQVRCRENGRTDSGYEHWRWEAKGCEIPRFNGTDMLERLRGKRMVIVGDSLNRNQKSNQWCYNQTHPVTNETYIERFPSSMVLVVERTIREMKTPVKYLNITKLSEFRRDGHTAIYTTRGGKLLTVDERKQPEIYSDCSHWCLPGLPDAWNVLIYASMVGTPAITL